MGSVYTMDTGILLRALPSWAEAMGTEHPLPSWVPFGAQAVAMERALRPSWWWHGSCVEGTPTSADRAYTFFLLLFIMWKVTADDSTSHNFCTSHSETAVEARTNYRGSNTSGRENAVNWQPNVIIHFAACVRDGCEHKVGDVIILPGDEAAVWSALEPGELRLYWKDKIYMILERERG